LSFLHKYFDDKVIFKSVFIYTLDISANRSFRIIKFLNISTKSFFPCIIHINYLSGTCDN